MTLARGKLATTVAELIVEGADFVSGSSAREIEAMTRGEVTRSGGGVKAAVEKIDKD